MAEIKPRFEFRTFAQGFGVAERNIRNLSAVENIRESTETYIMSQQNNENNTKIRESLMDIKVFVQEKHSLEQWNPRVKESFPMTADVINKEVFPLFGVDIPEFHRNIYTLDQYLDEIIRPHPDLQAVHVFKRRFAFTINNCSVELADVYINGARIKSASIESADADLVLETKRMVDLDNYQNINYLLAIKRVIGMEKDPIPW